MSGSVKKKSGTSPLAATGKLRLKRLRKRMDKAGLDGFVISTRTNSLYYSLFPCSNSVILVTAKDAFFLTDFRYLEKAHREISHLTVVRSTQHTALELSSLVKQLGVKTLGFEGDISFQDFERFKKAAGKARLVESGSIIRSLRAVKDADELAIIAANQKTNERIYKQALKEARPGMSEADLQKLIRRIMLDLGVEEAFDTIVATGPNSSLPHAIPGGGRIKAGEYLLIDMGVKHNWYHSDMTRTVCVHKSSALHEEIYAIVLEAQLAALRAVGPGVPCAEIDGAARTVIAEAGFSDAFGHGLGHGVGLEIHEAPTLNPRSTDILEPGMVVTIEPGIYLPGFGGVRIEDLVIVTETGYQNLTSLPKRFHCTVKN
jgi:Xaa-Pro aminopeptidase